MLRLILFLVYLAATTSTAPQIKQGGGIDPLGLNTPPPPTTTDAGAGYDPNGAPTN
jgi:hypothetical protein